MYGSVMNLTHGNVIKIELLVNELNNINKQFSQQ